MKKNTVLFYASVKDYSDFNKQKFYVEDIEILKSFDFDVKCTNKISDFIFLSYDIAFLYFYKWSTFSALFARIRLKKVIFTGGLDDLSPIITANRTLRFFYQFLFFINYLFGYKLNIVSKSDFLNASQIYFIKYFEKYFNKFVFFPHSVDFNFSNSKFGKIPHSFVTICWMGSKSNVIRKGVDKSLFFFKRYLAIFPDAKLYIIGKLGEGTEYLKSLDIFTSIENNVEFTGFVQESAKNQILNSSMFYLQFSNYEGFGVAALEANIARCYVLHTGSGGFLSTDDIWGKKISFRNGFFDESDLSWLFDFSFSHQLVDFESNFKSNFFKYTRACRSKNWKNCFYE